MLILTYATTVAYFVPINFELRSKGFSYQSSVNAVLGYVSFIQCSITQKYEKITNLQDLPNQKSKDEDQARLLHKCLAASIAPHRNKSQATDMILNLCKISVSLHCQPSLRSKTAWQMDGRRKCKTNPVTKKNTVSRILLNSQPTVLSSE
jgi:hypothetical protein